MPLAGNISQQEKCVDLINFTISKLKGIDVLINNAGVFHFCSLQNITDQMLTEIMHVSIEILIYLTRLALNYLTNSQHGMIINISPLVDLVSLPQVSGYSATKRVLDEFTGSMREKVGHIPVKICNISSCQLATVLACEQKKISIILPQQTNSRNGYFVD
ncbi:MAG: SDR family oxidoreductase [Arsenophonus endosymbiont of Dermacentor nuttalli]